MTDTPRPAARVEADRFGDPVVIDADGNVAARYALTQNAWRNAREHAARLNRPDPVIPRPRTEPPCRP